MIELSTKLLDHQKSAYNKIEGLRVGALYMEMGTGKTRTMLEILKNKISKDKIDKIIWFCPCSARENIKRELEKHLTNGHDYFIIVGIESISSSIKLNSYLHDFVRKYKCAIVVDESLKIKNFKAKRTQRIIALGEQCRYRYILNGTPISRDERDLFAQWYFIDWRILGYKSMWSFDNNHVKYHKEYKNRVTGTKNVDYLARKIAPYTYQVKLKDCIDLPSKVYDVKYFWLSDNQNKQYDLLSDYLLDEVDEWKPETIYRLFSILQGVCAGFTYEFEDGEIIKTGFDSNNPRLKRLLDIVEDMDGKIIIYCEYRIEVETILDLLNNEYGRGSAVSFYGGTSTKDRNKNIRLFEGASRFLVASKDCAAYSLNLQFCHQVIYYNNDWDYGTRSQSEDRIYRIGQVEKSHYIDIVASNTIEENIMRCLNRKERLVDVIKNEVDRCKDKESKKLIVEKVVKVGKNKVVKNESIKIVGDLIEQENISREKCL